MGAARVAIPGRTPPDGILAQWYDSDRVTTIRPTLDNRNRRIKVELQLVAANKKAPDPRFRRSGALFVTPAGFEPALPP